MQEAHGLPHLPHTQRPLPLRGHGSVRPPCLQHTGRWGLQGAALLPPPSTHWGQVGKRASRCRAGLSGLPPPLPRPSPAQALFCRPACRRSEPAPARGPPWAGSAWALSLPTLP